MLALGQGLVRVYSFSSDVFVANRFAGKQLIGENRVEPDSLESSTRREESLLRLIQNAFPGAAELVSRSIQQSLK